MDEQMEGKTYICGDRLTLADIQLYCFLSFGAAVGQPLNPELANINAWNKRMAELPSAQA